MIQIALLVLGLGILAAYWYSRRTDDFTVMSVANITLNPAMIVLLFLSGAWGAIFLPLGFVLVEAFEIRSKRRSRRLLREGNATTVDPV